MMPPFLLAKLFGVPRFIWAFGAVALLTVGFLWWLAAEKQKAVIADRNAARAEAVSRAREADERAERASDSTREGIEDGNDRAREAARTSDDPLADGLRSLRPKTD